MHVTASKKDFRTTVPFPLIQLMKLYHRKAGVVIEMGLGQIASRDKR